VPRVSQKTLAAVMRALRDFGSPHSEIEDPPDLTTFFYGHDFPGWFITQARSQYSFDWREIIPDLRNTRFFHTHGYFDPPGHNVTGTPFLSDVELASTGETLLERLTALAATLPEGEAVRRSLELEGFRVNAAKLTLEPAKSVVNEQEEENRLVALIKQTRLQNEFVILKHLGDAHELFVQGKDHPSIGESRNLIQALIDDTSGATHAHGGHSVGYPGGTANRLQYLQDVGFFTLDEKAAFGAAWGFLSAGSHPGIPSRDEARIGLILSLEFAQVLLLKFTKWMANGFRGF
jgi:hypothetical protein